jgi:hypothetical protein
MEERWFIKEINRIILLMGYHYVHSISIFTDMNNINVASNAININTVTVPVIGKWIN